MIRIIISITKVVIAAIVALLFASCQFDVKTIVGSGKVISQTRHVGDFQKVLAQRGLEVVVEQADEFSVVVEADDNLQQHIITRVENGTLVITSEFNSYTDVQSKKVTVRMPGIAGLEAEGGSSLKSVGILTSEDIVLKTSGGAMMDVNVESDKILAESASGSNLSVEGKALNLEVSSSSGSETDAGKLLSNEIDAQASSGSHVVVHPIVKLDAKASSGASIQYNNVPKNLIKKQSSGGSVSQ